MSSSRSSDCGSLTSTEDGDATPTANVAPSTSLEAAASTSQATEFEQIEAARQENAKRVTFEAGSAPGNYARVRIRWLREFVRELVEAKKANALPTFRLVKAVEETADGEEEEVQVLQQVGVSAQGHAFACKYIWMLCIPHNQVCTHGHAWAASMQWRVRC